MGFLFFKHFIVKGHKPPALLLTGCFIFIFGACSCAQNFKGSPLARAAHEKFPEAVSELISFLALPNDGHFPDQVQSNLAWSREAFEALDFKVQVLPTEGAPLLFAEKQFRAKNKTILFYLQIDGQPVDRQKWSQPDPFIAVLKAKDSITGDWQILDRAALGTEFNPDWRLFARSVSDSKGPAMAFISALDILRDQKVKPRFNIKVIMDFQEEMGSPHLADAVGKYKELLGADMMLIMDGTRHPSNLPTLTYGARGIATATLKVFGPAYPLHSGQYGNFAPNPVFETARLLAGLKDENGRVTLPGFYDGIQISEKEKILLNQIPEDAERLKTSLGISRTDGIGSTYQEALQFPSLNIRGLQSAWVGTEVRTVIPSEVITEFDMRLVPESDGKELMELLKGHIVQQGYHLVDSMPTAKDRKTYPKLASFHYRLGSQPFRTDMDSPTGEFLNRAMSKVFGDQVVNMRTTGGSQPIAPFINTLGIPAVSIRIPNPDNSIHAPNENLRLGNFYEGILSCLAILDEPFR